MKVLLVHPEDTPKDLAPGSWDKIIDLGWSPASTYEQWTAQFHCPVETLHKYHHAQQELDFFFRVAAAGKHLTDKENINWWELFLLFYCMERMEVISRLQCMTDSLGGDVHFFVTRACFEADVVKRWRKVHIVRSPSKLRKLRHFVGEIDALPLWELRQIFWDKYDPAFAVRRRFMRKRSGAAMPVILVPSTYVNSSKTAINFASKLPEKNFLLVTTRVSGELKETPGNVQTTKLGAYACSRGFQSECMRIVEAWDVMRRKLADDPDMAILDSLSLVMGFPKFLECGLGIRDAWGHLLDQESVEAVLSCDNNPFMLLPVLLAKRRNIPTVSSHHGALDWRYRILPPHADVVLAKGRMEQDYLVRVCGVPPEKVEMGAPVIPEATFAMNEAQSRDSIVFFSEAYEAHGARADEIYKEILVPLANLAFKAGRQLVIKLHPFENAKRRRKLAYAIVPATMHSILHVIAGPLTPALLGRTWFGVTVLSTVAMECTAAGIPCFLCEWLEYPHHGYGDQFRRYGAGYTLHTADEVSDIPKKIESKPVGSLIDDLWQAIPERELEQLFTSDRNLSLAAYS